MNFAAKLTAVAGLMVLGACSNVTNPGSIRGGAGTGGVGDVSNPASPAYFEQVVGDRVLFEVDQSSLTPEAQTVLAGQATWLINNPDYTAIIEGHADEQGTREYNLGLGASRANAVREYLIERGISGRRLQTVSFGKERPIEICSAESCYAKNRRAVTVLVSSVTG